MLTVGEAIRQRRSVRSFKQVLVPDDMILEMLEAARLAPSASNVQPWRYAVVTDPKEKKEMRKLCLNQQFIEDAGVLFIICVDLSSYTKGAHKKRRQEAVDAGFIPASSLNDPVYQERIDAIDDSDLTDQMAPATANTYIATEHIVLTAAALGLGSCWVGGVSDYKAVRDLLGIPRGIMVIGVVAVGYTDIEPKQRPHLALDEILARPFSPSTDDK